MRDVSLTRLYILRATYLLIAVGLGLMIWPLILQGTADAEHMKAVVRCLLGAVGLLAVLGIRYPLQMLPVLLFELVWKTIWIIAVGLPLWMRHAFTAGTRETWSDCLVGIVIVAIAIPWRYVVTQYALIPGDRWTRRETDAMAAPSAAGSTSR
jgi:hypothetical protein